MISFFLSVSFPRIRRQACLHRSEYVTLTTSARILTAPVGRVWRFTRFYSVASLLEKRFSCHHSFPYFFILLFPTAFYDRSRMTGRFLISFCKKLFLPFCSRLPLSSAPLTLSPCPGTAYISYTFLLRRKIIYRLSKTQFSRAVILERRAEPE